MQIDWWTLGLQTVNFLIVVWLLSRFLYRPVRRIIQDREASDRKLSEEARAKAEAADAMRRDYERKMAEFAEQRRRKEAELQNAVEKERDAILREAREKSDALLAETRAKLDDERQDALNDLKSEIAALAADLARKALAPGASAQAALRLATEHLDSLSPQELAELRNDVSSAEGAVVVVTAAPLEDEMRSAWRSELSERLGPELKVDFDADPELIGGAEVHFPHAALRLSVAQRLTDAAESMKV